MSTFAAPRPGPRPLDPERLASHMERLTRVARHLTGRHGDAEDLVQDTFARVLAKPRLLRNDDDLGYLLRVLRNTFISNRRTAIRRPAIATAPENEPNAEEVAESSVPAISGSAPLPRRKLSKSAPAPSSG